MNEYNIIQSFIVNNPVYIKQTKRNKTGYMQHSTGAPGGKAKGFIDKWNKTSSTVAVEFVIDETGIYQCLPLGIRSWHCAGTGNNTHIGCEICEPENARMLDANWLTLSQGGKNNTTYAVTMLQRELGAWGYDPRGVDGVFGAGCKAAVISFQKDRCLTEDGCVGLKTLHEFQKREGSYLLYNINENQAYFEDVYRKAVYTCAYVLKEIGQKTIDNNSVLCHCEGYKAGIASNHADVLHWFPQHGKTMDDFRADVKTYIETGVLPFSEEIKPIDIAWTKAQKIGLFEGMKQSDKLTVGALALVLDKLNFLK